MLYKVLIFKQCGTKHDCYLTKLHAKMIILITKQTTNKKHTKETADQRQRWD